MDTWTDGLVSKGLIWGSDPGGVDPGTPGSRVLRMTDWSYLGMPNPGSKKEPEVASLELDGLAERVSLGEGPKWDILGAPNGP